MTFLVVPTIEARARALLSIAPAQKGNLYLPKRSKGKGFFTKMLISVDS